MRAPTAPARLPYRDGATSPAPAADALDERILLCFVLALGVARAAMTARAGAAWDGATTALCALALLAARRLFEVERAARPPR